MNNYTLNAKLTCDGTAIATSDFENDCFELTLEQTDTSLKAVLTAKKDLVLNDFMLTTGRTFRDNDLFFSNGFQSWSTTEEHGRNDDP